MEGGIEALRFVSFQPNERQAMKKKIKIPRNKSTVPHVVIIRDETPPPPVHEIVLVKASPKIQVVHTCYYDAEAKAYRFKFAGEAG